MKLVKILLGIVYLYYYFSTFIVKWILSKKIKETTLHPELISNDLSKYNRLVLFGELDKHFIYLNLNLNSKKITLHFYKDKKEKIFFSKNFNQFYSTSYLFYLSNDLLKLDFIEDKINIEFSSQNFFINLECNLLYDKIFQYGHGYQMFQKLQIHQGLWINGEETEKMSGELYLLKYYKSQPENKVFLQLKNKIFFLDIKTGINIFNDIILKDKDSSSNYEYFSLLRKDISETKSKLFLTYTDMNYDHYFYQFNKIDTILGLNKRGFFVNIT